MSGLERFIFDFFSGVCGVLVIVFYVWGLWSFIKKYDLFERFYDLFKKEKGHLNKPAGFWEVVWFIAVMIMFFFIPIFVFVAATRGGYGIEKVWSFLGE